MTPLTPEALSIVAVAAAAVAVLALLVAIAGVRRAGRLRSHYRLLMEGVDGVDLAAVLETMGRRLGGTEANVEALETAAADLDGRLARALQRFEVLRYNAYGDSGGDQSFSIAMLDADASGIVITSLHGRDGVRVYAKPIDRGRSTYSLSDDEQRAIAGAREGRSGTSSSASS
jgi:hypothetical protein